MDLSITARTATIFMILFSLHAKNSFSQDLWRSELYPFHWQPGFARGEKFLHDFSYAGYHYGEASIPDVQTNILDVTASPFLADNTGISDATLAIQAAIDSVAKLGKGVIYLPAGTYNVSPQGSNALLVSSDSTILRGDGPDQTFILNTEANMRSKTIIQIKPQHGSWYAPRGESINFSHDATEQDTIIYLTDVSSFSPGDRIILTTDFTADFIAEHQMTGKWTTSLEGVAFCRTIESINTADNSIEIDIPIRYYLKMRDKARAYHIQPQIRECGIENLSIGNLQSEKSGLGENDYSVSSTAAYDVHASHAIDVRYAENCWVKNVHTYRPQANTDDIHVLSNALQLFQSRLVTVDSCILQKPQYEGGGGNGYMFTLRGNDCLITNCQAIHSRHNYDFKKAYANGNVIHNSLSKDSKYATDFHMHLSMSNLFDCHTVDNDFLEAVYRPYGSIEHGHSTTQSVFWNTRGERYHGNSSRIVASGQWGYGYVIGTSGEATGVSLPTGNNTLPEDHLEGEATGDGLRPVSLYLDQLDRRLHGLSRVDSTNWDAPVISISSPLDHTTLPAGSIEIKVNVSGEKVERVEYHANGNLLGVSTAVPYSFVWEDVANGCYDVTAQAFTESGTVSTVETIQFIVGAGCEESYYDFAFPLPGKIEAEYFNKGLNGHGYFDTDANNQGGDYRTNEPVDIQSCNDVGGGYNIGWISDGEYLRYIVQIEDGGKYHFQFRAASQNSGQIAAEFQHNDVSVSTNIASTGGWQDWTTVESAPFDLEAGQDTIQLNFTGSFNLNYFELQEYQSDILVAETLNEISFFPNPVNRVIHVKSQQPFTSYKLINLVGKVVQKGYLNGKTSNIDLIRHESASYVLEIQGADWLYRGIVVKE